MEVITTIHGTKKAKGGTVVWTVLQSPTLADVFPSRIVKQKGAPSCWKNNSPKITLLLWASKTSQPRLKSNDSVISTRKCSHCLCVCHLQEIACRLHLIAQVTEGWSIVWRFETKVKVNSLVQLGKTGNRFQMNTIWLSHYQFVFDSTSPRLVWFHAPTFFLSSEHMF